MAAGRVIAHAVCVIANKEHHMTLANVAFDSGTTEHDPRLYDPEVIAQAEPAGDSLTDQQVAFYQEHGWIAIDQVLTADEVQASLATIDRLITSPQAWRGTLYEAAAKAKLHEMTPEQRRDAVRKLGFYDQEARACGLPVDHPRLLRFISQLMGGRKPILFQTMCLLKPPHIGREKPWHQDHAYFNIAVEDRIVGVWIALDEATVDNGCMQLLDRGHTLGPIHHWKRRDWQICDTDILGKKSVAVPLKPGGALFFDSLLPHGTPTNRSPLRRRAMQFHYAPENHRAISNDQRMAVFGTEGKDVSC